MDITVTDQIRGAAIFMIILSHYITRVFTPGTSHYYWIFKDTGGIGVGAFLLVSGYGLMSSYLQKGFQKLYLIKRLLRIYLPYWFFIILWIILDIYLLNIHHTAKEILAGFAGIVVLGDYIKEINPSLWFITLIIFYYILFFIVFSLKISQIKQVILLILGSSITILMSRYLGLKYGYAALDQWGDYSLYFPVGVLLALNYKSLQKLYTLISKDNTKFIYLLLFIIAFLLGQYYPFILTFIIIIPFLFLSSINLFSRFLLFIGTISYELYLVHIPFLLKYDFILYRQPYFVSFFIYLGIMILLAWAAERIFSTYLLKKTYTWLNIK